MPTGTDPYGYPTYPNTSASQAHKFLRKARTNAPPQIADTGWLSQYMSNLMGILQSKGAISPEILQRNQASLGRSQMATEDSLRGAAGGLGGTSSPAYLATLAASRGGFARARGRARTDADTLQQERMRSDLQAANPILSLLQAYTSPKGGTNITGGAPGTKTDYFGAANSAAATVAQIIAAINAGKTAAPADTTYHLN